MEENHTVLTDPQKENFDKVKALKYCTMLRIKDRLVGYLGLKIK
jgi:hypothetical protein